MAKRVRVATTLNRLADQAFTEALSSRDQLAMSDLVADFFCDAPDTEDSDLEEEEELGKWQLPFLVERHNSSQT